jgi:hypothetical protein
MNIHTQAVDAGIDVPLTREKNDELYILLVVGDQTARRRMIEGNLALVVTKVNQYIVSFPFIEFLREDMIGEGLLALTNAVDDLQARGLVENPNPTGYICKAVQNEIGHLVDEELHLQAPSRTLRHRRKKGKPVVTPPQVAIEPMHVDQIQDPMGMTDLRDMISAACEDELDRMIVELRERSYTYQEIATRLDIPLTTAFVQLREIYGRFLEKSGMKGEV